MIQELAKELISQGLKEKAQDIYMMPRDNGYEIFMRIGDDRRYIAQYGDDIMLSLISHFKFVSGMNVGEKRRTQLGSCDYEFENKQVVSLRLSTVGDYRNKESLVIRILYTKQNRLTYWYDGIDNLKSALGGRGLYLFSGPVGSGKTTLMYELIRAVFYDKQIISIEDPVEIKDDSMLQLQLNESIGMTYDNLIKLSLRHRPDILIIGEIRDSETARAVIRASLTGAMVFSTIHAKSISGVYDRLLELGVSLEELRNGLTFVAYQRLLNGGALIDYRTEKFDKYIPDAWNEKISRLVKEGVITKEQGKVEKIKAIQTA